MYIKALVAIPIAWLEYFQKVPVVKWYVFVLGLSLSPVRAAPSAASCPVFIPSPEPAWPIQAAGPALGPELQM